MTTAASVAVPRRDVPRRPSSPAAPGTTPTTASTVASTSAPAPSPAPAPSIDKARRALSEARRLRGEYLVALASDLISPFDLVQAALTDDGKPLRRISLRQLHLSQKGWGERRTSRLLSVLAERLCEDETVQDKTVAWLIDPRSGGRRYLTWLDVQQGKTSAPWTGFPFTAPEEDR